MTDKKNADVELLLQPLRRDQVPKRIGDFFSDHPVFVRLYVPFIVTLSLVVQLFTPTGRG